MTIKKSFSKSLAIHQLRLLMMHAAQNERAILKSEPLETPKQRDERIHEAKIERYRKRGVKEFHYKSGSVWARNQKNADRKARNRGWL